MNKINDNTVILQGTLISYFTLSYDKNEKFYDNKIQIERTSGTVDILPIQVSEKLLTDNIKNGTYVRIIGEIRTRNIPYEEGKTHLSMFVFVKNIYEETKGEGEEDINQVDIEGYICKEPGFRVTPFGREVCDAIVAVNRRFNKASYIPCIMWGRNAKFTSNLQVGNVVRITGRLQSREYVKNDTTKTAYELSCSSINKICDVEAI